MKLIQRNFLYAINHIGYPHKGRDKDLETFISNVLDIPLTSNKRTSVKYNLFKSQQNSIKSLANDENIILKEADKGDATVIMDRSFYQTQIENILSNQDYYKELDKSPYKDLKKSCTCTKYLEQYESTLTKKELDYLTNFESKASNFYGLPKIHKCKDINEACSISNTNYVELKAPDNLTFRPIVAGPICETHRLSNLIDILSQGYSKYVKVKDKQ